MVKHVVKRDGRVVIFDNRKIVDAILKAMNVTEEGEDIVLAAEIASAISKIDIDNMSVEELLEYADSSASSAKTTAFIIAAVLAGFGMLMIVKPAKAAAPAAKKKSKKRV